jgi:glucose dehydrogenase
LKNLLAAPGMAARLARPDAALESDIIVAYWPMAYDDLEPWYCEAERELGVAGDSDARLDAPRSRPYPLPAIPLSYLDRRVAAAVARLAYTIETTPQARKSQPFGSRPACCGSRRHALRAARRGSGWAAVWLHGSSSARQPITI